MSFFNDKDQPIDYSNEYNENIGSISPKSNNYDSHLTSYHSNNLFRNDDFSLFNQNKQFNQHFNNQNNHFNQLNNQQKMNSNKVLDNKEDCIKDNYSYLFQDTTDCVTIYQTEDSPIIYSNDSPLSSLSLEFLPNLNPNDNLLNNKQFDNENNQLNSSNDSIQNYNMEGTPNCFSYDSPLSPLSLNLSFEDSNSFDLNSRMSSINELKNKKEFDLKSTMSIDKSKQSSTRSSTNKLYKSSFGQLNNTNDEFSLLDLKQINQITPSFLNNNLVNQQNNQESQENYSKTIDFEDGFEEYDNEQFYLNQCISAGRQTNNKRNSNSQQQQQFNSQQQQQQFNTNQQTFNDIQSFNNHNYETSFNQEQLSGEKIEYIKVINTKGPYIKDLIEKRIQKKMIQSSNQQQLQNTKYNQQILNQPNNYQKSQRQDKLKYPNSVDMGYYSNIDKDTDSSTIITNFTREYGSRSTYTIDGQAQKHESSIKNAEISNRNGLTHLQKHRQQEQEPQLLNSSLDNSPKQVKKNPIKNYLKNINLFNKRK